MSALAFYRPSPVKRRRRATAAEMEERAEFLINYAALHGPITIRGLYYQAEVNRVPGIGKDERGYKKTQKQVLDLRRAHRLPYDHIADSTRWMRKPTTFNGVEDALRETARLYRKSLWEAAEVYLEIWCEKDALAGVIYPVTDENDVALMVARGYASETFCYESVAAREDDPRPYVVFYLGDFDRAGVDAARTLKEKLERFGAEMGVDVDFVHLAIEPSDIREFAPADEKALVNLNGQARWLPTREPKRQTAAEKAWPHACAIELDAIAPDDLRRMVREAIEHFLPAEQLKVLKVAEENERGILEAWADSRGEGRA